MRTALCVLFLSPLLPYLGADESTEYPATDGKFVANFPVKPQDSEQKTKDGPMRTFLALSGNKLFMIQVVDMVGLDKASPATAKIIMDRGRDGLITKNKIVSEKAIKLDDRYAGRDVLTEMPNRQGFMRLRLYVVDSSLYALVIIGPTEESVKAKDATDFYDSFRLVKK
jgi:hypothetical protein